MHASRQLLTHTALTQALSHLPLWQARPAQLAPGQVPNRLQRNFVFADFNAAFSFMAQVALEASRLDHHPEWQNIYSRVEIILTTHDAKGLTGLDIALATAIDSAAEGRVVG
jgi:4a-hydroxytetrahydrobiopterin dehydratase